MNGEARSKNYESRIKNREVKAHNSLFMLHNSCANSAFTVIELLLSIAVLSILFAVSVPLYQSFQVRNQFFVTVDTLSQNISRAQIRATYMEKDSGWGVKVNTTSNKIDDITLFKASDLSGVPTGFVGHDTNFDEIFNLYSSVQASGDTEIVFAKFTGEVSTPASGSATVTLTSPQIGDLQKVIRVNKKGNVTIADQ